MNWNGFRLKQNQSSRYLKLKICLTIFRTHGSEFYQIHLIWCTKWIYKELLIMRMRWAGIYFSLCMCMLHLILFYIGCLFEDCNSSCLYSIYSIIHIIFSCRFVMLKWCVLHTSVTHYRLILRILTYWFDMFTLEMVVSCSSICQKTEV